MIRAALPLCFLLGCQLIAPLPDPGEGGGGADGGGAACCDGKHDGECDDACKD